jgi:hypothetical protein
MAVQKIFKSAMPSFRYYFKNGMAAIFMMGRFTTDNKELEDELMAEVGQIGRAKSLNPYIYVDEAEPEFDTEAPTPMQLILLKAKEEARKELLAEMAAEAARAQDAKANVSTTDPTKFANSLNNTDLQQASMGTEATLQALATSSAQAPADTASTNTTAASADTSTVGARLAALKANSANTSGDAQY